MRALHFQSKSRSLLICAALAGVTAVGCSATKTPGDPNAPRGVDGLGKTDIANHVVSKGHLAFGDDNRMTGRFTEDGEQHGYTIRVVAGAEVTIAVESDQTPPPPFLPPGDVVSPVPEVETNLSVYGPGSWAVGFGGDKTLPSSGDFAANPSITATFATAGTYLVVVRTELDSGRGGYGIGVACDNNACEPPPPPAAICPTGVAEQIRDTVNDSLADEECAEDPSATLAAVIDDYLGEIWDYDCNSTWGSHPAWCLGSFAEFATAYEQPCRDELGLEYPSPAEPLTLVADATNEERLVEIVDAADGPYEDWNATAARIDDAGAITLDRAVATAALDIDAWCYMDVEMNEGSLLPVLAGNDLLEFISVARSAAGSTTYQVASLTGEIYYDTYQTTYVVLFPETGYLVTLTVIAGED